MSVPFTNDSNVPLEVMVFMFYFDEITIDVQTGLVTKTYELNIKPKAL